MTVLSMFQEYVMIVISREHIKITGRASLVDSWTCANYSTVY